MEILTLVNTILLVLIFRELQLIRKQATKEEPKRDN